MQTQDLFTLNSDIFNINVFASYWYSIDIAVNPSGWPTDGVKDEPVWNSIGMITEYIY